VLAGVGFLVWKQAQQPKAFANAAAAPDDGGGFLVDWCGQLAGVPESQSRGTGASRDNGFLNKDWKCCQPGVWAKKKPNNIGCRTRGGA
jgi:hypothetical protein